MSPQPSGDRDVNDEDEEQEEERRRVRVVEAPRGGAARGEARRRRVAMAAASAATSPAALRATWRLVPSMRPKASSCHICEAALPWRGLAIHPLRGRQRRHAWLH